MPTDRPLLRRLLLAVATVLAVLVAAPAFASAAPARGDASSSATASSALRAKVKAPSRAARNVAQRVAMERVRGPLYGRYYGKYAPVNWSKDGCSIPELPTWAKFVFPSVNGTRAAVAAFFKKSCDRHDFGYRNWGPKTGGVRLHPNRAGKKKIDSRFLSNMRIQCNRLRYIPGAEGKCDGVALIIYGAVRTKKGDEAFFSAR